MFATNDELFARLRAGNPGYDVIVPSNEFVTRMSQAQMIQELDRAKIPNFANLLPEFQDAAVRSGPPLFDALYLAGARHRLSQGQDADGRAGFLALPVRLAAIIPAASRCFRNRPT